MAKTMTASGMWVALATVVALAMGVTEKYSKNSSGEIVETRPAALMATMTEVKSGGDVSGIAGAARDGENPNRVRPAVSNTTARRPISGGDRSAHSTPRAEANRETRKLATAEASRLSPVRPVPVLRRIDSWRCEVIAPGAASYVQGGVTRPITAPFPCPVQGEARARWGSGLREIVVDYDSDELVAVTEVWPPEVKP